MSCVPLVTTTLPTVTPVTFTVVPPVTKLVPVKVTPTAVPTVPAGGLIERRVGPAAAP